jgi:hypothetical protein
VWTRVVILISMLAMGALLAAGLQWGATWLTALPALAVAAGAVLIVHGRSGYDAIYYYNTFSGEFLFALIRNEPDPEEVKDFIDRMRKAVKKKKERAKMESEVPSAATELHHLARLKEKEIITDDEYRQKKRDLIEDLLRD